MRLLSESIEQGTWLKGATMDGMCELASFGSQYLRIGQAGIVEIMDVTYWRQSTESLFRTKP